jgi:hypothetical protein
MAKFLDNTGVSYYLTQLIDNSMENLILISPYLNINDRIKARLQERDLLKRVTRIIYGKNEISSDLNWLKSLNYTHTSFCKDLHSKCYLNEKEAIVTSMNLISYSQVNNYEMGIYIDKVQDPELYNDVCKEVQKIILNSEEVRIDISKVSSDIKHERTSKANSNNRGYCIRCHSDVLLNPLVPYCKSCYSFWKIDKKEDHEEKYCHICGNTDKTSLLKPTCYSCYKSNKDILEFPTSK